MKNTQDRNGMIPSSKIPLKKQQYWKLWYAPLLIFGVILYVSAVDFLNPVLNLEEMTKTVGVIEKVVPTPKKGSGTLILRTPTGEHKKFSIYLYKNETNDLLGQQATVWSQSKFTLAWYEDYAWQLQVDGKIVSKYHKDYVEEGNLIGAFLIKLCSVIVLISLLGLWYGRRKNQKNFN